MAAETINAPVGRERESLAQRKPAVEFPPVIINDLVGGLDDASARIERLDTLFRSARVDMHDAITDLPTIGGGVTADQYDRLYDIWLVMQVAGEKCVEMKLIIERLTDKAYADRRERAA